MAQGGERFQVIVAGAGIAGAAMALFLSHLDTDLTVLESRPCRPNTTEGGMIVLGPNGMNVLRGLGLSSKLRQRETGIQVSHITMRDGSGDLIGRVPQGSSGTPWLLLLDALEEKRIDIRWNSRIESMEETDNNVLVRWSEAGETKEKKADVLIGADGIWSTTRPSMYERLGLAAIKPRYSGLVGIGFILDIDSVPGLATYLTMDQPIVMVHDHLGFVGMMLYDKKGKKVGWWTTHEASERSREEWKMPREQVFHELIQASEVSGGQPFIWPVYEVEKLGRWHSGRTVLIGDAAHAMPPHSGQGASQALEDAAYLAHLLRQYLQHRDPATDLQSVLDTFQKVRQPRVDEIVDEANRRGDMKRETSRVGMFVRKRMMRIIFFFMTQRWMDRWFAYKVPGIEDWETPRPGE
ncbi:FAD/NAD(P)-binding domain-containing protein [Pisolithus albus]|nr:FAD/NAD(P)-binding domain-containing protein [Pisolithus albus]